MDIFHHLPTELKFEVLLLLDCPTLVTLLTVYPLLQKRVVIITHRPYTEPPPILPSKHSIRALLPRAKHVNCSGISYSLPTHAYLKIFEVPTDVKSLAESDIKGSYYDRFNLPVHGVDAGRGTRGSKNYELERLWWQLMKYMDRNSVLTWSRQDANVGFDFVKGWLLQLSWITGATYHPFCPLLDLASDTQLPEFPRSPHLDTLTSIKVTVKEIFRILTVGTARTLSVEFTSREGQPELAVGSGDCLDTVRVYYHGELVPWVSLDNCFTNEQSSEELVFEMTRLHIEQSLTHNNNAGAHRQSYKGDLSFIDNCTQVSFAGVPDWLVLMCSYTSLTTFKWYRTDPTTVKISRSKKPPRLYMPELREFHVCSMIKHDSLPLISYTQTGSRNRYPLKRLQTLNIVIGAPGMNLNGILSSRARFDTILIRAHHTSDSTPALSLTEADLMSLSSRRLLLEGDIDLTPILNSTCQRKSRHDDQHLLWITMADLDLTTTARNSANNVVDLRSMPLGSSAQFQSLRITCSPSQPITLVLHRTRPEFCSDAQLEKKASKYHRGLRYAPDDFYHSNPELFLSWNMIHSTTFEGRLIVPDDFTRSKEAMDLEYSHFLFDPETRRYIFCEVCLDCVLRFKRLEYL